MHIYIYIYIYIRIERERRRDNMCIYIYIYIYISTYTYIIHIGDTYCVTLGVLCENLYDFMKTSVGFCIVCLVSCCLDALSVLHRCDCPFLRKD